MTSESPVRALAAVLGAADGGQIEPPELRDGRAWDPVLAGAGERGLMPALWSASRRLGLLAPVPDDLLEVLGRSDRRHAAGVLQLAHRVNGERNADLMTQFDDVTDLLAGAGIRVVALKGSGHVARGVWPDPADRMMADLDLLVPADAAAEAQSRLLSAGYELAVVPLREPDRHHLDAVQRPGHCGAIEVHVEPLARGWTDALRASEVLARAVPVSGRPAVLVPTPTHAAVIALVHGYLADDCWYDRAVPLRTVHELWRIDAREAIDWSEVRFLLRRVGRARLVSEYLVTAASLLGAPAPNRSFATARARARFTISDSHWRRPMSSLDTVTKALDAGRLRRHYGTAIGGPWRLRAHHLRRVLLRGFARGNG